MEQTVRSDELLSATPTFFRHLMQIRLLFVERHGARVDGRYLLLGDEAPALIAETRHGDAGDECAVRWGADVTRAEDCARLKVERRLHAGACAQYAADELSGRPYLPHLKRFARRARPILAAVDDVELCHLILAQIVLNTA